MAAGRGFEQLVEAIAWLVENSRIWFIPRPQML